jgi:peptidoglycan/xylan/chitin deacetylase (PgdA/CDA1 family)
MFNKDFFAYILFILLIPIWIFLYFSLFNNYILLNSYKNPEVASFKSLENSPQTKKIPVLMFHYVEINQNKNDFLRDNLNTNPLIFEKQILTFKNAGYEFIWASEIPKALSDKSDKKYVVFTFDDGYETFFLQTYPIIKKHKIKVTNYIISDFIGKPNYMNKNQLTKVYSEGLLEIGSHTLNHPGLTIISKSEAIKQLVDSKKNLESIFGTKVNSFCYPYGFYNEEIASLVRDAGYTNATTTKLGSVVSDDALFTINRIRPGIMYDGELLKYIDSINY